MNFVFDHNCNPELIGVVQRLVPGHQFEDLRITHPDAADEEWIPLIKARREPWVAVSQDKRRFRNPVERELLKAHPITWVALMGTYIYAHFDEQARRLSAAWPSLVRHIGRQSEPWVYKIKQVPGHRPNGKPHPVTVEHYAPISAL